MSTDFRLCKNEKERIFSKFDDRQSSGASRFPQAIVFFLNLKNSSNDEEKRIKVCADTQLISYSFLVNLINRLFDLNSNFTLVAKENNFNSNFLVSDDFDVDGCLMNSIEEKENSPLEFLVFQYPQCKEKISVDSNDWQIYDSNFFFESFELISIRNDSIVVSLKPKDRREESFLQKATGWLHGSVKSSTFSPLTKKNFIRMFDEDQLRLIDPVGFRQKIFDHGCDPSIRKVVWCYLLRIFNESMTHQDKEQKLNRNKERYNEMKQAWIDRQTNSDVVINELVNLIEKDVARTDRSVKFFVDEQNRSQQKLFHILMTFSVYHPEPGYVQGMNDMAAVILYVMHDEALSYACFCALMRYMSPLFDSNGTSIRRRLNLLKKTLRAIDFEVWKKIEECDVGKLMFAYRWVLLDCKREFPFNEVFNVLETIWASLPSDKFESTNLTNSAFEREEFIESNSIGPTRSSTISSLCTKFFSNESSTSSTTDEVQSQNSSLDGGDSGYREENLPTVSDNKNEISSNCFSSNNDFQSLKSIPLGSWLTDFATTDDEENSSDIFTNFLCVALIEQNRSAIMQMTSNNHDNDDFIGTYFTRHVRKHDARQALDLARNYYRQYVLFQMRVKHLLTTEI